MPIITIPIADSGLLRDPWAPDLKDGAWADGRNAAFGKGYLCRTAGHVAPYGAAPIRVYNAFPLSAGSDRVWIEAGTEKLYAVRGDGLHENITRQDGGVDVDYSADPGRGWTGTVIGGVAIINNGVDAPQAYGGTGRAANLPNWPSTWRARSIRAYRNLLVAMNITDGSDRYRHQVRWSTYADPGTVPPTWTPAPTNAAGDIDLADDPTEIMDGLPLGGSFIIYKEGAYYALTFVGGSQVMNLQRISGDAGLIGPNCVVAFPGGHFCVGQGDVYVHEGGPPRSVIDVRMREWLFNTIDAGQLSRMWVAANPIADELWIGIPTGGDYGCSLAAIWSWKSDAWTVRELPGVSGAGTGVVDALAMNTWAQQTKTWAEMSSAWGQLGIPPSAQRLMLASSQHSKLLLTNQGDTFDGAPISAFVRREGMTFGDPFRVKLLRRVRPMIDARPGTTLRMRMGAAMDQTTGTVWGEWRDYIVGTHEWFDDFASGKFLAFEMRSGDDDNNDWRMRGMLMDVEPQGYY